MFSLYFCKIKLKTLKMLSFFKDYKWFAIVFSIISIIIISIFYNILKVEKPLPIYQPSMVNTELVDSTIQHKINYHKIADFSLINQNGKTIKPKRMNEGPIIPDKSSINKEQSSIVLLSSPPRMSSITVWFPTCPPPV